MKFDILRLILVILLITSIAALENAIKKRTATDFFNELFTETDSMDAPPSGSAPLGSAPKPSGLGPSPSSAAPSGEAKNSTNIASGNPPSADGMLQDWLMISSPQFKDAFKFPPVHLLNGTVLVITCDSVFFRENDGFKPKSTDIALPPTKKYFWFRLSGSNLYYSSTGTDINILGAVAVRTITSVEHLAVEAGTNGEACFQVKDLENQVWKLCAVTTEIRTKWVCKIQNVLKMPLDAACGGSQNNDNVNANKTIIQPIIIIPIPSPHCNDDWNYQQNGRNWQCDCSEGLEQTPINLPLKEKAIDSPIKPMFQYEEIIVKSSITTIEGQMRENENLKLRLADNSLRIMHHNMGKVVTLDGAIYYAQELIIHTPAEHTIKGKKYDMEVQIIHYGQTKGDIAKQIVLSFLFEKKAGVYNKFLDDLDIFNLPNPISKQIDLSNNLFIPKILYSSDDEDVPIMKPFSFYTYQGSIPYPPCTEKTIVYVASKPISIGTTALQLFQEALRVPDIMNQKGDVIVSDWIPMNNRDTQPINGRPIFHYDHEKYCGPDPIRPPPKPMGHYEKVLKAMTKYFYVNDMNPSGIPGAFVVSAIEATGKDVSTVR